MGNLLAVKVHAANIVDTMSGCHVYQVVKSKFLSIRGGCGDVGYWGTFASFVRVKYGEFIDISEWIKSKLWQVLPRGGVWSGLLHGQIGLAFCQRTMRLNQFMKKMTL
jgi:putative transposase